MARVGVAAVIVVVPFLSSCSRQSPTEEVRVDPADEVVDGPAPTAPPASADAPDPASGALGQTDVNELIRRVDELNNEKDMCRLLSGQAVAEIIGADVNLTSLMTNPSGFTQLLASLDRLFAHMVTIGPPELVGSLRTVQGVWRSLASIDPRAPDAETRSAAILEDPAVQQAHDALAAYATASCVASGG